MTAIELPSRFRCGNVATLKDKSDYIHLRPYRAIVAPKLVPQKERDRLSYGTRRQSSPRAVDQPTSFRGLIVGAGLVLAAMVLALLWWLDVLHIPTLHHP
jgi:hypothetical protein